MNKDILNEILIEWDNSDIEDKDSGIIKKSYVKDKMMDHQPQLIYKVYREPSDFIIFHHWSNLYKRFKDKVYIEREQIKLDDGGWTVNKYEPGEYEVYIDGFDKVKEISKSTFQWNMNLISITIPKSVKKIGDCAFDGCTNLISVTIPNSVKTILRKAFFNCENLKKVYVESIYNFDNIVFGDSWSKPTCYGAELINMRAIKNEIFK